MRRARRLLPPASRSRSPSAHCRSGARPGAAARRDRRRRGRRFYCERAAARLLVLLRQAQAARAGEPAPPPAPSATSQLDAITAELRELKAKAILEPTPANVTAYIRFQREQLDRASLFSDVWQRAIWQDPELDYTLQRPVSTLGKRQWQDARSAERNAVMAQLGAALRAVLLLRAELRRLRGDVADRAKRSPSTWHITVRAISTDGGPSRHFPNYTVETNQRTAHGPRARRSRRRSCSGTRATGRAIPIGYGVMSADELQDRIYLLTSKEAGRDY